MKSTPSKSVNDHPGTYSATAESRLLRWMIVLSFAVHAALFIVVSLRGNHPPLALQDEVAIDIDIVGDEDGQSAIPDTEVAKSAKAAETMLPQLPKTIALKEETTNPDTLEVTKKDPPQALVEKKPEPEPESKPLEDKAAAIKLKLLELKKRQALERLRLAEETEKTSQAPLQDPMARIANQVSQDKRDQAAGASRAKLYGISLKKRISQHYTLPKTFSSPIADLRVVLAIIVNGRGELVSVEVQKSSSDQTFDEYTILAAKNAAPFDKPPKILAGRTIHVAFRR